MTKVSIIYSPKYSDKSEYGLDLHKLLERFIPSAKFKVQNKAQLFDVLNRIADNVCNKNEEMIIHLVLHGNDDVVAVYKWGVIPERVSWKELKGPLTKLRGASKYLIVTAQVVKGLI